MTSITVNLPVFIGGQEVFKAMAQRLRNCDADRSEPALHQLVSYLLNAKHASMLCASMLYDDWIYSCSCTALLCLLTSMCAWFAAQMCCNDQLYSVKLYGTCVRNKPKCTRLCIAFLLCVTSQY